MLLSSSSLLNPSSTAKLPFLSFPHSPNPNSSKLHFPSKFHSVSPSFLSPYAAPADDFDDEDRIIGDCLVFEDGAFEDPNLESTSNFDNTETESTEIKDRRRKKIKEIEPENLVPEQWRHVQAEVNITKKERRKIAQQLEFGSRVEKKRTGYLPIRNVNLQEYLKQKADKLGQLHPDVFDNYSGVSVKEKEGNDDSKEAGPSSSERAAPRNPRWAVYGKGLEDVTEFFNSGRYQRGEKKSDGVARPKLFSMEEKAMLNMRVPDLSAAASGKWLPLHTLAASGEFDLAESLLKRNVDINAVDKDGLTALHKAIMGKKLAITNYLLRESANPFVRDEDGATLIHYAVQTASSQIIKVLLLYNVDINLQDKDGWTPLHLAVQSRRTDIVKLLLIKRADKTLRNKDGLTPLDLCLYSGRDTRTYELIKLLKEFPRNRRTVVQSLSSPESENQSSGSVSVDL